MMFHPMRRKDRMANEKTTREILETGSYGVLATLGANGYPTGTPVNYGVIGDAIYIHTAITGNVAESIGDNPKVSFTVVNRSDVVAGEFVTNYESCIVHGTASIVEGQEKYDGLYALIKKYSMAFEAAGIAHIKEDISHCNVFKIQIEHMTGKVRTGD